MPATTSLFDHYAAARIGRNAGYLGEGGYVWVDIGGKEIRAEGL
jgi:hypothetical protein